MFKSLLKCKSIHLFQVLKNNGFLYAKKLYFFIGINYSYKKTSVQQSMISIYIKYRLISILNTFKEFEKFQQSLYVE